MAQVPDRSPVCSYVPYICQETAECQCRAASARLIRSFLGRWAAAAFRLALALLVRRQRCSPSRANDFYVLYHLGPTDRDMRDAAGTAARPILSDISRKSPPQPQALRVCPPLLVVLGTFRRAGRGLGDEMDAEEHTRQKRNTHNLCMGDF